MKLIAKLEEKGPDTAPPPPPIRQLPPDAPPPMTIPGQIKQIQQTQNQDSSIFDGGYMQMYQDRYVKEVNEIAKDRLTLQLRNDSRFDYNGVFIGSPELQALRPHRDLEDSNGKIFIVVEGMRLYMQGDGHFDPNYVPTSGYPNGTPEFWSNAAKIAKWGPDPTASIELVISAAHKQSLEKNKYGGAISIQDFLLFWGSTAHIQKLAKEMGITGEVLVKQINKIGRETNRSTLNTDREGLKNISHILDSIEAQQKTK
jgi:hypothetical protein